MTTGFDPYEILGVDRTANDDEIRQAAKRAAKETHPDAGGTDEAFNDTRRALAILTDPKRRSNFDRSGDADDVPPNNVEAAARMIIASKLDGMINGYLMSDFDDLKDPRKIDVVANVTALIKADIQQTSHIIKTGRRHVDLLEDVAARFTMKSGTGFDIVNRLLEDRIGETRAKMAELEEAIEHLNKAVEMLGNYQFRKDEFQAFYGFDMGTGGMTTSFFFRS